jgi:hypothetical protein
VDAYKWEALERHSAMVQLKYDDPKLYASRAAFLPPVLADTSERKEAFAMADLRVEIAKRKLLLQQQLLLQRMGQEMLEKNCAALSITDPKEREQKYQQILRYLRTQDEVGRCAACCCDENMGSVIEFYKRVYQIYCQKDTFVSLLEAIKGVTSEGQAPACQQIHQLERFPTFTILYDKCVRANVAFHAIVQPLVELRKGQYLAGPIKTKDSCETKLRRKYHNDHTRLVDVIRGTGIFRQPAKLLECLKAIIAGGETTTDARHR